MQLAKYPIREEESISNAFVPLVLLCCGFFNGLLPNLEKNT